jgi:hypothetical protein
MQKIKWSVLLPALQVILTAVTFRLAYQFEWLFEPWSRVPTTLEVRLGETAFIAKAACRGLSAPVVPMFLALAQIAELWRPLLLFRVAGFTTGDLLFL